MCDLYEARIEVLIEEKEILQDKLDIAVNALEFYKDENTWDCCVKCRCAYVDGSIAHQALAKIKGIK